jgi:hypothetical protein
MWSTRIGGPRPRFVFLLSIHSLVDGPRDDTSADPAIGSDCALISGQSARFAHVALSSRATRASESTSSRRHGPSPASRRCIGAALSAAHPQQNSTRNRHRRSTWAGVSWPNDDDIGASGGENIGRTLARTRTTRSLRCVTSHCAPSSEHLPVRLRASCSRRNGSATPQRFIEARQHEGRHLRALLVGQPA